MLKLCKIILGLLVLALPTLAQEPPHPSPEIPFAFVTSGELLWAQYDNISTVAQDNITYNYNAVFSPDGTQLAYTVMVSQDSRESQIWVASELGVQSVLVTTQQLMAGMPLSWTPDGRIVFMRDTNEFVDGILYAQVYAVDPTEAATPELLFDKVEIGVGCGGGSSDPIDLRYWEETDMGGSRSILAVTPVGLVFSGACAGGMTTFLDDNGEVVVLNEGNLVSAIVAPDGTRLAGIVREPGDLGGKIVVYELPSLAFTEYTVPDGAWQLAWSADGNLYYASAIITGNLLADLTEEQRKLFADVQGYVDYVPDSYERNETRIYRLELADGSTTLLYKGDGSRIGRIVATENFVFFSEIPNGDTYLEAILNGVITFENYFELAPQFVQTRVFAFNLRENTYQQVFDNASQFVMGK